MYDGSCVHERREVGPRQLLVTGAGAEWTLRAGARVAQLLLLRGTPLGEPVAQYGPFVMNTPEESEQAIRDYQSGQFA